MTERNLGAIQIGDYVASDFLVIESLSIGEELFTEPHIGIAATITPGGVLGNPHVAEFWKSLGAPPEAIWQPGADFPGAEIIAAKVDLASATYQAEGLLPEGESHTIYGEVISFDGISKPADADNNPYIDNVPHIDFAPPETPCAVIFESNQGGTIGWRGEYIYGGTVQPHYAYQASTMEQTEVAPGMFLFAPDARTFIHARAEAITNVGRVLTRMFIGV